jgi:hypothetical protein
MFDPPGSIATYANSINADGSITGYYEDNTGLAYGFVRASDGTITTFDVADSAYTISDSVNKKNMITGYFAIKRKHGNVLHGFVRRADGTLKLFKVPRSFDTYPASINETGRVAGSFVDNTGIVHGFLRTP